MSPQYESEVVYHQIREDLEEQGVIFLDTDTALREHEDLFKEYFGTVIPSATTSSPRSTPRCGRAARSSTSRKGVHVDIPLQAYFRINTENMGQFERTLIIVDEDAYVHYVEGCTAPIYPPTRCTPRSWRSSSEGRPLPLHDHPELVEQRLQPRHQARRLRGRRHDGVGRRQHRLQGDDEVPAVYLMGEHAKGETLSIAFAGEGQHQDAGAKMVHAAPTPRARS